MPQRTQRLRKRNRQSAHKRRRKAFNREAKKSNTTPAKLRAKKATAVAGNRRNHERRPEKEYSWGYQAKHTWH